MSYFSLKSLQDMQQSFFKIKNTEIGIKRQEP